ncbi:MAG: DUF2184 domain-containing protein [Elusimicrobiota bacterium]|jgi:hypothetical protein|nr:DUF2184 domain-containing protein [Elusimicrobiota bacterium]
MSRLTILNSKGEKILLNSREAALASILHNSNGERLNAMGIEIDITTLTTVIKSVSEQKFYEVRPSEFMPVMVGEGAFNTQLIKYVSFNMGGDFEDGIIHQGTGNSKLAQTDAGVEALTIKIINWAKGNIWNLFEVKTATQNGNWDIITEKEKSRKKNWDLGIQRIAFLGAKNIEGVEGLLTLSNVNSNTQLIQKPISAMNEAEYMNFIAALYEAFRANCNRTAEPDLFIIPESDYNGLAVATTGSFPIISKLEYLKKALKEIIGKDVGIQKLAYGDKRHDGLHFNRYVFLKKDADTLALNIPVDYTSTIANTINGFNFENTAYGQFAGVRAFRPLEVLYFDYSPV